MDTFDAITSRRSIRKYREEPISRKSLEKILQAGIDAPSSKNRQPWAFTVVTGGAKETMLDAMSAGIHREKEMPLLPNSRRHMAAAEHTLDIMRTAPAVIMITNPLEEATRLPRDIEEQFYCLANAQSVGAAIQNMCLAAVALELGTLWICDIYFAYPELCRWLGSDRRLMAALAVGVPDENPPGRPRKPREETVNWLE